MQCPICGSHRVYSKTLTADRRTGKRVPETDLAGRAILSLRLIHVLVFLVAGVFLLTAGVTERTPLAVLGGVAAILYAIHLMGHAKRASDEVHKTETLERYNYECYQCGHKWSRRADEPSPQFTVRPDLIERIAHRRDAEPRRRHEK